MATAKLVTLILTLVICALGLIGNFLCAVVLSHKDMSYSYVYNLLGLTYANVVLLLLSIFRTLDNIQVISLYSHSFMKHFIFIVDWICTSGTKYYTVAISLERFFVVTFPLRSNQWFSLGKSRAYSGLTFLIVVAISATSYVYNFHIDQESYHIYTVVVLHFVPFVLVLFFNMFIFLGLRRFRAHRSTMSEAEASVESVTKMLFVVVTVFGFCSSFEIVRQIMIYIWPSYMSAHDHYDYVISHLADIFCVLNASIDFPIYCLLGRKFRSVFYTVLRIQCATCAPTEDSDQAAGKRRKVSSQDTTDHQL